MQVPTNNYVECPYKIRLQVDKVVYWQWCCDTLVIGYWRKMIGFMGGSGTYCFHNAEDATAFKLRFGV